MRELKFRVWDISQRQYLIPYGQYYGGTKFYCPYGPNKNNIVGIDWFIDCQNLETPTRFIVEQYTGYRDKNGQEIYEGDILGGFFNTDRSSYEVKWDKAYSGFQWCEWQTVDCDGNKMQPRMDFYGGINSDYKVVIGNIHE